MFIPIIVSLIIVVLLYLFGIKSFPSLLLICGSSFIFVSILIEYINGVRARYLIKKEMVLVALIKLVLKNRRRYIGFVVHFAIGMIFIGFTGAYYSQQKEVVMSPGGFIKFSEYEIKYMSLNTNKLENRISVVAELEVRNDNNLATKLHPSKDFYEQWEEPMSEVDIISTAKGDLYAVLLGWQENGNAWFKFFLNPFVNWIWYGGWLLIIATTVLLLPEKLFDVLNK
jgi:cytochrome c-type biogenesis protein CcmF